MHGGNIEENVPSYTQIGPGIWKYLGKNRDKTPTPPWAVSRAGYSRKSKLKKNELETFTIAGEVLLWRSFIPTNAITAKQKN